MADIEIIQAEADGLIAMEKHCVDAEQQWYFPAPGDRIAIALTSIDKRENFMLDVTRARIKLTKATYQNRARQALVLMRLDLDGPPHRNPDGKESHARTCTLTVRDTATSGRLQPRLSDTSIHW